MATSLQLAAGDPALLAAVQRARKLLNRRARRTLTAQELQAIGLQERVLSRLVAEAALDSRAAALGLAVSDQLVVDSIRTL